MPTIPDFRSMAWQTAKTDLEIVHQIQDGKEPVMPPFRGKLSQKQILGLAIYLRAFAVSTTAERISLGLRNHCRWSHPSKRHQKPSRLCRQAGRKFRRPPRKPLHPLP